MHHFLKTMAKYAQQIDSQLSFQMGHKRGEQDGPATAPGRRRGW
jgi:hypothetical protein